MCHSWRCSIVDILYHNLAVTGKGDLCIAAGDMLPEQRLLNDLPSSMPGVLRATLFSPIFARSERTVNAFAAGLFAG